MVKIAAIASGSNGNSYYFENEGEAVLIDAGISCKQIVLRMNNLGLSLKRLNGIFVTHEHSDHVRGIEILSKHHGIPLYINEGTYNACKFRVNDRLVNFIKGKEKLGNITVNPFTKNHDAADPCSYLVSAEKKNVGVMTDIGEKCPNVVKNLGKCDAVFLESNYDEHMLEKGFYPHFLKKRIGGSLGHFSNYQAALLVVEHGLPKLKHVFLSHLSANTNTPELALQTFTGLIKERKDLDVRTVVTSREKESELLDL